MTNGNVIHGLFLQLRKDSEMNPLSSLCTLLEFCTATPVNMRSWALCIFMTGILHQIDWSVVFNFVNTSIKASWFKGDIFCGGLSFLFVKWIELG